MTEVEQPPQTNGIDTTEEDENSAVRPADIEADMREMERRKRVEAIMCSRLFREELERIVDSHGREGASGILQQLSDMVGVPAARVGSVFKSSNCVLPINDIRGVESMGYAKGEKILRCKMASTFRLLDLYGWTHGLGAQITARLNNDQELFLVNPFGLLYHEVTASSLNKVNMQGLIVEQGTTNFGINNGHFVLHSAVHAARPDLRCAIYVGCNPVVAVSSLKVGLLPLTNDAAVLGEVALHTYTGALNEPEEREKLIRSLGPISKVLLLTNHGALCCGETIEEAFYAAYHIVQACETQLKLLPVGLDNLNLIPEEARKAIYDASRKAPEGFEPKPKDNAENNKEGVRHQAPKWRVGGAEYEALMRMLDNAGFRTGYIYRNPLVKSELPKPRNDVEVPPAVSSLGYLLEEEELYRQGVWKKHDLRKGGDRSKWLNSPNVYQKVEVLETGTPDPRKITKWVADGSPTHSSTAVKIDGALQFVPHGTNPKEFKKLQQLIKDNRRADKISAGPQSHILEGVTWDEANKITKDSNVTTSGASDHVVLMGAASKGIIQRGYQHNATVYKAPYAKNPFDSVTDDELNDYKKTVERKRHGDYTDTDFSESEGLSSLQISGPPKSSALSQSADESEPQVHRIETKQAPKPSQPEVVLSDANAEFLSMERVHAGKPPTGRAKEITNKRPQIRRSLYDELDNTVNNNYINTNNNYYTNINNNNTQLNINEANSSKGWELMKIQNSRNHNHPTNTNINSCQTSKYNSKYVIDNLNRIIDEFDRLMDLVVHHYSLSNNVTESSDHEYEYIASTNENHYSIPIYCTIDNDNSSNEYEYVDEYEQSVTNYRLNSQVSSYCSSPDYSGPLNTPSKSPYRTVSHYGFNSPREYFEPNHYHIPLTPTKYVPISRDMSMEDFFSTNKYINCSDNSVQNILKRKRRSLIKFKRVYNVDSNSVINSNGKRQKLSPPDDNDDYDIDVSFLINELNAQQSDFDDDNDSCTNIDDHFSDENIESQSYVAFDNVEKLGQNCGNDIGTISTISELRPTFVFNQNLETIEEEEFATATATEPDHFEQLENNDAVPKLIIGEIPKTDTKQLTIGPKTVLDFASELNKSHQLPGFAKDVNHQYVLNYFPPNEVDTVSCNQQLQNIEQASLVSNKYTQTNFTINWELLKYLNDNIENTFDSNDKEIDPNEPKTINNENSQITRKNENPILSSENIGFTNTKQSNLEYNSDLNSMVFNADNKVDNLVEAANTEIHISEKIDLISFENFSNVASNSKEVQSVEPVLIATEENDNQPSENNLLFETDLDAMDLNAENNGHSNFTENLDVSSRKSSNSSSDIFESFSDAIHIEISQNEISETKTEGELVPANLPPNDIILNVLKKVQLIDASTNSSNNLSNFLTHDAKSISADAQVCNDLSTNKIDEIQYNTRSTTKKVDEIQNDANFSESPVNEIQNAYSSNSPTNKIDKILYDANSSESSTKIVDEMEYDANSSQSPTEKVDQMQNAYSSESPTKNIDEIQCNTNSSESPTKKIDEIQNDANLSESTTKKIDEIQFNTNSSVSITKKVDEIQNDANFSESPTEKVNEKQNTYSSNSPTKIVDEMQYDANSSESPTKCVDELQNDAYSLDNDINSETSSFDFDLNSFFIESISSQVSSKISDTSSAYFAVAHISSESDHKSESNSPDMCCVQLVCDKINTAKISEKVKETDTVPKESEQLDLNIFPSEKTNDPNIIIDQDTFSYECNNFDTYSLSSDAQTDISTKRSQNLEVITTQPVSTKTQCIDDANHLTKPLSTVQADVKENAKNAVIDIETGNADCTFDINSTINDDVCNNDKLSSNSTQFSSDSSYEVFVKETLNEIINGIIEVALEDKENNGSIEKLKKAQINVGETFAQKLSELNFATESPNLDYPNDDNTGTIHSPQTLTKILDSVDLLQEQNFRQDNENTPITCLSNSNKLMLRSERMTRKEEFMDIWNDHLVEISNQTKIINTTSENENDSESLLSSPDDMQLNSMERKVLTKIKKSNLDQDENSIFVKIKSAIKDKKVRKFNATFDQSFSEIKHTPIKTNESKDGRPSSTPTNNISVPINFSNLNLSNVHHNSCENITKLSPSTSSSRIPISKSMSKSKSFVSDVSSNTSSKADIITNNGNLSKSSNKSKTRRPSLNASKVRPHIPSPAKSNSNGGNNNKIRRCKRNFVAENILNASRNQRKTAPKKHLPSSSNNIAKKTPTYKSNTNTSAIFGANPFTSPIANKSVTSFQTRQSKSGSPCIWVTISPKNRKSIYRRRSSLISPRSRLRKNLFSDDDGTSTNNDVQPKNFTNIDNFIRDCNNDVSGQAFNSEMNQLNYETAKLKQIVATIGDHITNIDVSAINKNFDEVLALDDEIKHEKVKCSVLAEEQKRNDLKRFSLSDDDDN